MLIGFDGKRLAKNFTGLGNYSRYVVNLLQNVFPGNRLLIYSPVALPAGLLEKFKRSGVRTPSIPFAASFWRSFRLPGVLKRDGIELYHGLSNELPFGISSTGIAAVVTIHDLIFLKFPAYYPFIDRTIYQFKVRYACRAANRIIAISERTKLDICDLLHVPASKIDVVYQDCDSSFKTRTTMAQKLAIKNKYALPDQFLLSVGTVEERKNLLLVMRALTLLAGDVHVVVIGKETAYAGVVRKYIEQNGLQERVHFLRDVPFRDLPGIYQQAGIFVYPSRYEGFGIPVVEALHSAVPVIAATGSCLEEAGGDSSLYTDPDNYEQLAGLIQLVLNDPVKRMDMITAGKAHVDKFNNLVVASEIMNVYQKAINDNQGNN